MRPRVPERASPTRAWIEPSELRRHRVAVIDPRSSHGVPGKASVANDIAKDQLTVHVQAVAENRIGEREETDNMPRAVDHGRKHSRFDRHRAALRFGP